MHSKKILITGASGYVGARLYSDLSSEDEVVGTFHKNKLLDDLVQVDLTQRDQVDELVEEVKPDVVIHCAAMASRKPCEENPEATQALNVDATRYSLEASKKLGAKFIFCSTLAAIEPSNVYGKTKKEAEEIVSRYKKATIIRLSLAFGISPYEKNDKIFNQILDHVRNKTDAEFSCAWCFNMTYLGHVTEVVTEIIERDDLLGKIIPIVASGDTTIYQVSKDVMSKFDLDVKELPGDPTGEPEEVDLGIYQKLGLPVYSYGEVIERLVEEIKGVVVR